MFTGGRHKIVPLKWAWFSGRRFLAVLSFSLKVSPIFASNSWRVSCSLWKISPLVRMGLMPITCFIVFPQLLLKRSCVSLWLMSINPTVPHRNFLNAECTLLKSMGISDTFRREPYSLSYNHRQQLVLRTIQSNKRFFQVFRRRRGAIYLFIYLKGSKVNTANILIHNWQSLCSTVTYSCSRCQKIKF